MAAVVSLVVSVVSIVVSNVGKLVSEVVGRVVSMLWSVSMLHAQRTGVIIADASNIEMIFSLCVNMVNSCKRFLSINLIISHCDLLPLFRW